MRISAIIPAAGTGRRIRKSRGKNLPPKALLPLGRKSILKHTVERLLAARSIREVVIAVHPRYLREGRRGIVAPHFGKRIQWVRGGKTRTESVWNALKQVKPNSTHVLIHDGVRPFVKKETIERLIRSMGDAKAVILARPMVPTVKEVRRGYVLRTVERSALWEAQTPQLFERKLLRRAFRNYFRNPFQATDEGSLVERLGERVKIVRSDEPNMKITTAEDWEFARRAVDSFVPLRIGFGEDRHRLVPGRALMLGGVRIPCSFVAQGHSDGDVLLHALIDAILGAAGSEDIGDHFPDWDRRTRGISSATMLGKVLTEIARRGLTVQQADLTVILERPKLSRWKRVIQAKVAKLLGLSRDRVGIKAKTAEGLGPEGEGQSILAHALVTLGEAR